MTSSFARALYEEIPEFEEVYIWLLGKIGSPIDHPAVAAAQVVMKGNNHIDEVKHEINGVLDDELENIHKFCMELAEGKISSC